MACPLEIFFLGLISTQLLWKDVILDSRFKLHAPDQVSVEEGLCVMVPCTFTYYEQYFSRHRLDGFWKKGTEAGGNPPVVANSFQKSAQDHFQIVGDVASGDCSLLISNAQKNYTGHYFFRMEKGRTKYNYLDSSKPYLNITEKQPPKIQILATMTEGRSATITCATFASCNRMLLNFTWNGFSKSIDPPQQLNGTQVYSVVNFLPSAEDHKRNITCRVNYTNETNPVPRETTVQLNVVFKPQVLGISVERFLSNKSQENSTILSQLSVQKGDFIWLHCNVNSNPSSTVTWAKGTQNLTQPQALNVLQLSDLKTEDAGTYTCCAINEMGFGNASFELRVTDPEKTLLLSVTGTLITLAVIVLILGAIIAFKKYRRKRKRVVDSEAGSTLTNAKKPNTSDLAAQEVNAVSPKSRSPHESVDGDPGDPEEIHYATLSFSVPNPQPDIIAEEVSTDYAEIRPCNSQGQEA